MSIDEALVSILENNPGVASLVGSRIYPLFARQTAVKPFVIYQRISSERLHSHSGTSGLARPRCQVRCVAGSYSELRSLATAVRVALDGYQGSVGTMRIDAITLENEIDSEDVAADQQANAYSCLLDFFIWHGE